MIQKVRTLLDVIVESVQIVSSTWLVTMHFRKNTHVCMHVIPYNAVLTMIAK